MNEKYQVFVSSTFEDLKDERRAVIEEILNMGHIPVGMESFEAANEAQWEYVKKRIAASDYFVVIIAERYGSVDEHGISFTQREYEYARQMKVPVAAFPLSDEARATWPTKHVEYDRKEEISAFRRLVGKCLYKTWSTPAQLRAETGRALNKLIQDWPRTGWIRADALFDILGPRTDDSAKASSTLRATVERDLSTAGYYRTDQVLDFWIEETTDPKKRPRLCLQFGSTIVPVHDVATVRKPSIAAPRGVRLVESTYHVGEVEVRDTMAVERGRPKRDCLKVVYESRSESLTSVRDRHYWPSPVLEYSIRFRKNERFRFRVGRVVGQTDPQQIDFETRDDCMVALAQGALTAQGLEWELSPNGEGSHHV
jgi:hypothetical protein